MTWTMNRNPLACFAVRLALTVAAGAMGAAHAEALPCIQRTWQGTIGTARVTLVFESLPSLELGGPYWTGGRYYYGTSMDDLLLKPDDRVQGRWTEIDPKGRLSGSLTLTCEGDKLDGDWRSPDGTKILPFHAKSTWSEPYEKARLAALRPTAVKHASLGGIRYDILQVPGPDLETIHGLRLQGGSPGIAKINETLLQDMMSGIDESSYCRANGRLRLGEKHNHYVNLDDEMGSVSPTHVTVWYVTDSYCGQAHIYFQDMASTFDLRTGEKEDMKTWLAAPYRNQDNVSPASALGRWIMRQYRRQEPDNYEGCVDHITINTYTMSPSAKGMVFDIEAPYVHTRCAVMVTVPGKVMAPFLSSHGKKYLTRFVDAR